jgi:hypothetical protein
VIDLCLCFALDFRIHRHCEDERLEGSDRLREINPQLLSPLFDSLLTVSEPAIYIDPGTIFEAVTSRSDEFSSSFDNMFAVTDGAAVPEA